MQRINSQNAPAEASFASFRSASGQVLLNRLLLQHVWEQMPDEQLKEACFSRGGAENPFEIL